MKPDAIGLQGTTPNRVTERPDLFTGTDNLIHYVMDLEALVKWFALLFSYEDPNTGEVVVNDPIWTVYDERGNYLAEADRLQKTWARVMGDTVRRPDRPPPDDGKENV